MEKNEDCIIIDFGRGEKVHYLSEAILVENKRQKPKGKNFKNCWIEFVNKKNEQ